MTKEISMPKSQIPTAKLQRSLKQQIPNTCEAFESLGLEGSLELGGWNLGFGRWDLFRHSSFVIGHSLCIVMLLFASAHAESIVSSKHNLSLTGPGDIKAVAEAEICVFCHTPHQSTGDTPLWNHQMSVQHYTPYSSSTLKATDVGQPTGS